MTKLKAICLAILCAIFISIAQIFQKIGAQRLPEILTNWPIFIGIFLYIIALLALITAFKEGEITFVFPIVAVSYILVTVYALLIFNEPISTLRWIGVVLIFAGVTMIGAGKK
ncbi:EamA family transporter [Candidatus Woesearchaeota archaeon]|nr:EamA family transporter [Candidatus Woesearchaeota archaeon]